MKIAIVGCAHGEIKEIITAIQKFETQHKCKIDLLICCGDFQAVRNEHDLCNMATPPKYRRFNSFYKYYSGQITAPFPIIVIGGNHEASNYMFELYHGGWLAPNIYFLGTVGSIMFGGLRISGLSGIFKKHDFNKGQHETLPLNENSLRSSYHVRRYNIWKLSQLHSHPIDIMMSHDWPTCIWKYGNYKTLIKYKSHFEEDILKQQLGNPALNHLLFQLQPKQWFAGHLHVKFSAVVKHKDTANVTRFLALDKFDKKNKRRMFVQMLDFANPLDAQRDEKTGFYKFEYDAVWLAIIKSTNKFMSTNAMPFPLPIKDKSKFSKERWDYRPTQQEIQEVIDAFDGDLSLPQNFVKTVSVPSEPLDPHLKFKGQSPRYVDNPQTMWLMDKLGIQDKLSEKHKLIYSLQSDKLSVPYGLGQSNEGKNDDVMFKWINDSVDKEDNNCNAQKTEGEVQDPNEIDIDVDADPNEIDIGVDADPNEIDVDVNADPNEIDIDVDADPNEIKLDPPLKKLKRS